MFEAHKYSTSAYFDIFHIFCPITCNCKSDKCQTVQDIASVCNLCVLKFHGYIKVSKMPQGPNL